MSKFDIRGQFVWHELMTTDTDAAIEFYSRVVPWKAQDSGMPSYTIWMAGKSQAGGLMELPEEGDSTAPPRWIIYIGAPDVDGTVAAAEKLGARVLKGASDIPNIGRFAVLSDPQGAAFAVFAPQPRSGGAAPAPGGGLGDFTWHELATMDPDAAFRFYSELFGWSKGAAHDMGELGTYQIVSHGGRDTAGIYKARDNSTPPSWLSYARVADAAKAASAAKAAGGRILNGPMEVPGGSWIVMMLDPQGGAFAVVEAPRTKTASESSAGGMSDKDSSSAAAKKTARSTSANQAATRKTAAKKGAPPKKTAAKKTAAKKTASSRKSGPAARAGAARKTKTAATGKSAKKKGAAAKKSTTAKRGSPARKAAKRKAKAKK